MRPTMLPTAALAALLATGGLAQADTFRFGDSPPPVISGRPVTNVSVPVACAMAPGRHPDQWAIYVVNTWANYTIPQGAQISWNTLNGLSGSTTVGAGGLAPDQVIQVGTSPEPWSCFAGLTL